VNGITLVKTENHRAKIFNEFLGNCEYYEIKTTHNSKTFIDVEVIVQMCRDTITARREYKTILRIIKSKGNDVYSVKQTLDIIIKDARCRKFYEHVDNLYKLKSMQITY